MSQLLENTESGANTKKKVADLRFCTICHEQFPVASVTWVGGRWACSKCVENSGLTEVVEPTVEAALEATPSDLLEPIKLVDQTLRHATTWGRYGFYGVACYGAIESDVVADLLHGLVMADLATWMSTAWLDFKFNRVPVILELIGFTALTNIMIHTDAISLPSDPASLGLAFLSFTLFFTIKGTIALVTRIHDLDANR